MNPTRTVAPSIEPITLAEAKLHLRVDQNAEDALISTLIVAARETAEKRLNRTLIDSTWALTLNGFSGAFELPFGPVQDVTGISYKDTAGATQSLSLSSFEVDRTSEPTWLVKAAGVTLPETYDGLGTVTVTYTAGYGAAATDVPAAIRQWLLVAVAELYQQGRTLSTMSTAAAAKYAVPVGFVEHLLDPYVVYR